MTEAASPVVIRECRSLTRYLTGHEPSNPVIRAYARGLDSHSFRSGRPATPLDETLLWLASIGSGLAGLADAWGRIFAPAGHLRRRLVLLLAVLECVAPDCEALDQPASSRGASIAGTLLAGAGFATRFVLALPLVVILYVPTAVRSRFSRRFAAPAVEDEA